MYFIGWVISKLPLDGQIVVTLVIAGGVTLAVAVSSNNRGGRHRGGSAL